MEIGHRQRDDETDQPLELSRPPEGNQLPKGVATFSFEQFAGESITTEVAAISMPRDTEVDLIVKLGSTRMPREDAMQLRGGSVVPLDGSTGDPVDVFAGGRLVARGEPLVLDGNFCVRVTELINEMKACG
jgi:flagellar motor switch protein FliN/FliY